MSTEAAWPFQRRTEAPAAAVAPPPGWLHGRDTSPRVAGRPGRERIWPELRALTAGPSPEPERVLEPGPPPVPDLAFSEAELARLCAAAAARAAAVAARAARDRHAAERLAVDTRLAQALEGLAAAIQARRAELGAEAVGLGAALGRALAGEALRADPLAAARSLLTELLPELADEPEVTVEVPAEHADELRAGLAAAAGDGGRPRLVEVRGDPALRAGEVRLAWRDGWAERLAADVEARAAAVLAALAGEGPGRGAVEVTMAAEDAA